MEPWILVVASGDADRTEAARRELEVARWRVRVAHSRQEVSRLLGLEPNVVVVVGSSTASSGRSVMQLIHRRRARLPVVTVSTATTGSRPDTLRPVLPGPEAPGGTTSCAPGSVARTVGEVLRRASAPGARAEVGCAHGFVVPWQLEPGATPHGAPSGERLVAGVPGAGVAHAPIGARPERRRRPRIECQLGVRARGRGSRFQGAGRTRDVSGNGACLLLLSECGEVARGAALELTFLDFERPERPVAVVPAEVAWVSRQAGQHVAGAPTTVVGVSFARPLACFNAVRQVSSAH